MSHNQDVLDQLKVMIDQMNQITLKQTEHDQLLGYLNGRINESPTIPVPNINENNVPKCQLDLFRIPDPIKSIPTFDGNRKQVSAWLKTAEDTLNLFAPVVPEQQFKMYVQAVCNKIEGKAKDIICLAGNPESFTEIKEILLESLGDRHELSYYKSQLWTTKMNDSHIHQYYTRMKEIIQNIKTLAKQNQLYSNHWNAIYAFIEDDALAAFISGLRKPYFGYAQASKPKSIEEAYAFLCKFSSNESISSNSKNPQRPNLSLLTQSQRPNITSLGQSATFNKNHNFISNPNHQNPNHSNYKPQPLPRREFKQEVKNKTELEPMEVDPSFRSRLTYNRKLVNNHEISNLENTDNLDDIDNFFCEDQESKPND